jgi:hypothetical protein
MFLTELKIKTLHQREGFFCDLGSIKMDYAVILTKLRFEQQQKKSQLRFISTFC